MATRWTWRPAAMVACALITGLLVGCGRRTAHRLPAVAAAAPDRVSLRVYAYVDDEFRARLGRTDQAARAVVNDWLWRCERQFQAGFPRHRWSVCLVGLGNWRIAPGVLDGRAIWCDAVPQRWPAGVSANCLMALTGRRRVCWSGIACWPRLYAKAQEHEPVGTNTVALLCHEMSHWFGAVDIIDADLPEASIMNYRDAHDGWRDGRICWDKSNRQRMEAAMVAWPRA
ncbi:MAG: hypothetical protein HZB16_17825 [Armatimonadetes bacterium]|nr:hypothetical protein [Armatimonadota bacterium]